VSENLNHETGGVIVDEDIYTEECCNTKLIIVQSAEPSTTYDGQHWIDTDDDPPLLRTRDETNSQWMTHYRREYETGHASLPDINDNVINGMMTVEWDSIDSKAALWVRANNWWWARRSS